MIIPVYDSRGLCRPTGCLNCVCKQKLDKHVLVRPQTPHCQDQSASGVFTSPDTRMPWETCLQCIWGVKIVALSHPCGFNLSIGRKLSITQLIVYRKLSRWDLSNGNLAVNVWIMTSWQDGRIPLREWVRSDFLQKNDMSRSNTFVLNIPCHL